MKLPTEEQALGYFDEFVVPKNIKAHCLAVRKYSNFFASKLKEAGMDIDLELIDRMALVHDLFKAVTLDLTKPDPFHNYTASEEELAKWRELKEKYEGLHESKIFFEVFGEEFPEFSQAVKNSSHPLREKNVEELIVHYIDWRTLKEDLVTLEKRWEYLYDKYPQNREIYKESAKLIKQEERDLFLHLDFSPEELKGMADGRE